MTPYIHPRKGCKLTPEHRAKISAARIRNGPTAAVRFWAKVRKGGANECWLWISPAERKGYGVMWFENKVRYAHRISWVLAGRTLTEGMVIDHICRATKCVNPDHLRLVPPRVNTLDNNLSPAATNARKTHCMRGHEFTPENTGRQLPKRTKTRHGKPGKPGWRRYCRTCTRMQAAARAALNPKSS